MSPPTALPRAVIFDWDNTLVDSWGIIHASLVVTLEAMGHTPWTVEETRKRARRSLRDSFPELFGARWEDARAIYFNHFKENHLTHLRAMPGAGALLHSLHDRGVYLAVVSNKTGRFLRAEAEALNWTRYFGRLVGAADAEADKPAVAPVALALAPADLTVEGLDTGHAWFVGDADIDMECAHAARCLPVFVGDGGDDLDQFPPAVRFATCHGLCDFIRSLNAPISCSSPSKVG